MATFTGQLRSNEIFSALYNMIISQEVFADNLGEHQTLVDKARVDGGLFGDTKLYYSTDVLKSVPWGNDAEATNLLALHRPEAPECQAIHLDVFRQICLTVDNYLSKRAWSDEGAFSSFNSVMLGWMRETKRVYDGTLYDVYIGTTKAAGAGQTVKVDLTEAEALEGTEKAKMEAMLIAQALADLMVAMGDYSRDFNDYGNLRSYAEDGIKVIWNSKFVNKIRKVDLPTIFHKDGLVDKFEEEVLPARYFGSETEIQGANVRSKIEMDVATAAGQVCTHLFPGDLIPTGVKKVTAATKDSLNRDVASKVTDIAASEKYYEDAGVICKVLVKLPPYMSAFEVGTSFFNPKSLTENHYLTFGHNTIEYLKNYPFITVRVK